MTALDKWQAWEARTFPDGSGRPVPDPELDSTMAPGDYVWLGDPIPDIGVVHAPRGGISYVDNAGTPVADWPDDLTEDEQARIDQLLAQLDVLVVRTVEAAERQARFMRAVQRFGEALTNATGRLIVAGLTRTVTG